MDAFNNLPRRLDAFAVGTTNVHLTYFIKIGGVMDKSLAIIFIYGFRPEAVEPGEPLALSCPH